MLTVTIDKIINHVTGKWMAVDSTKGNKPVVPGVPGVPSAPGVPDKANNQIAEPEQDQKQGTNTEMEDPGHENPLALA